MRIEVNINKKYFIILSSLLIVLIGSVIVYTYGGTSPSTIGHSAGEVEGTIPSGFCIFSDTITECPVGWTRKESFDGRTVRGAGTPGDTGGSDTHNHGMSKSNDHKEGIGSKDQITDRTNPASSWPPYINVLVCCKD